MPAGGDREHQGSAASGEARTAAERWVSLLPQVLLVLGAWWILLAQGRFLIDDSYIGFRYAANLAAGHGLVWNPGDPVEGYTNLLWLLLLAPFARLGLDLTLPAAVLGTLAACGTLEILRRIAARTWPERSPLARSLPALLLATNPSFAFWSTSGMETPLFALFVLLGAHLLVEGRAAPRRRLLAGLALAGACLTRPEGLLVSGVLLLVELGAAAGSLWSRARPLLAPGLIVLGTVLAHLAFRWHYYHDLLPNTFYAKVILGWLSLERGVIHLGTFLLAGGVALVPGLLALRGPARPHLVQGYVLLGAYLAYLLVIGGDHPDWFRFYVPLMPLPLLGLADLAARAGEAITRRSTWLAAGAGRRRALGALGTLGLVALVLPCWARGERAYSPIVRLAGTKNVGLYFHFFKPQVPPDSVVAASAVGMIGYYTPYRIIDTWGLNDRHIAHLDQPASPRAKFGHDKGDWLYVLNARPDFIFTFNSGKPQRLVGYDICWPSHLGLGSVIYRRRAPLTEAERGLGVPPGWKRTLLATPECKVPAAPRAPR